MDNVENARFVSLARVISWSTPCLKEFNCCIWNTNNLVETSLTSIILGCVVQNLQDSCELTSKDHFLGITTKTGKARESCDRECA